jgi:hypothetical protein
MNTMWLTDFHPHQPRRRLAMTHYHYVFPGLNRVQQMSDPIPRLTNTDFFHCMVLKLCTFYSVH